MTEISDSIVAAANLLHLVAKAKEEAETIANMSEMYPGGIAATYAENPVRGDAAWKGKTVKFRGKVESISTVAITGSPIVYVECEHNGHQIRVGCYCSKSVAASLSPDRAVIVVGKVSGYTLGRLFVADCAIDPAE